MQTLTNLLPTLVMGISALIGTFHDPIYQWLDAHPTVVIILGALGTIWGNLHPSPLAPK